LPSEYAVKVYGSVHVVAYNYVSNFHDGIDHAEMRKFKTLQEFSAATGHDKHSVLVDYDIFQRVSPPGPVNPTKLHNQADFDFRLHSGSAAVDAGTRLPNINDDFTERAPDLGAYEAGSPVPHYGPRP
jgi:hypothetical protein